MAKPTLIRPNGAAATTNPTQQQAVDLLKQLLADAEKGEIWSLVVVACGPNDFGSAMVGTDAPRMLLGLEVAKLTIMENVSGKRTVLHR